MRLPRMTTRRWMIVVVVLGLVMGGIVSGVRLKRGRDLSLDYAWGHSVEERFWRRQELRMRKSVGLARLDMQRAEEHQQAGWEARQNLQYYKRIVEMLQQRVVLASRMIEHHASLARKYERAARYPWLSVEPDPPEPE